MNDHKIQDMVVKKLKIWW